MRVKVIMKNGREINNALCYDCNDFKETLENLLPKYNWLFIENSVFNTSEIASITWEDDE